MLKIKKKRRAVTVLICLLILFCLSAYSESWFKLLPTVKGAADTYTLDIAHTDRTYTNINGLTYTNYADVYAAFTSASDVNTVIRNTDGKVIAMKQGMAVTHSATSTFVFTSTNPGGSTAYCINNVVAYYQSTSSAQEVTITISGYTGTCNVNDVILLPSAFIFPTATGERANQYEFDYYTNEGGELIHYTSYYHQSSNGSYYCTDFLGRIVLDKAPSFMTENIRYYSTDSIDYYTDPYDAARDVKTAATYKGTYCIYFKYLSYRTKTTHTASELNGYISYTNSTYSYYDNPGVTCAYLNMGSTFIGYQNTYGVNAAMELGFANLESAYGKSQFAVENFNFFGVGAVDSNPSNAEAYLNADDGIKQHMKYYMSRYYIDAYAYIDASKGTAYYDVPDKPAGYISYYAGDFRYFGNCPGNKAIGINVKYASDPFHGEKVASQMYAIDTALSASGNIDYNKYSIGFTNKITYAYAQPDDTSWKLYKYAAKDPNRPGNILSTGPIGISVTITGQTGDYYIIVSDMPINADGRACYTWDTTNTSPISFTAYVKKADITLMRDNLTVVTPPDDPTLTSSVYTITTASKTISKIPHSTAISDFTSGFANGSVKIFSGEDELTTGTIATGMTAKIYDASGNFVVDYQCVVTGDINGDGAISITDLVQINNNLLKKNILTGAFQNASDVNGDGKTTISDLVLINYHLLKKQLITPR